MKPKKERIAQDQNQARDEAMENERRYRELVEHANSVIIRIDSGFSILFVNEYALNFFGYAAEDLLGAHLLDTLVPARDPQGEDQHAASRRAVRNPEVHGNYDQLNRCKDGRQVWLHWTVRAIRDVRGQVRELLIVGVDISQRKEAEFRAERYRRRARRLADQLIASEEKERAQLATYLHDNIIQTLSLANIRMGEVLGEIGSTEAETVEERLVAVRRLLGEVVSECRSVMDRLAPALLDELGLGAALEHLVEKQPSNGGRRIELRNGLDDKTLPHDLSSLVFRTVRELLMNALKYAGPCRIVVSLWHEEDALKAQVEDDGTGFDVSVLEDIHYDDHGGFGLFTLRERLEGLGGKLDIESAPGSGTTARMTVPFRRHGLAGRLTG